MIGGIGVLNMMLDSVHERRQEIGVRLAIGARRRDIVVQFLVETFAIACAGGLVGVALGIGGCALLGELRGAGPGAGAGALGAHRRARARDPRRRGAAGGRDPRLARGADRSRADAADGVTWTCCSRTLQSLRAHALRFALTSLGIVWGAFVLTYLTASMQGFDDALHDASWRRSAPRSCWSGPARCSRTASASAARARSSSRTRTSRRSRRSPRSRRRRRISRSGRRSCARAGAPSCSR